ncbi:MAG: EAL domain-containing protein [Solirubrobacteraceae bacterium]
MTAARIALLGRVGIDQDGRPSGRGLPGRRAELVFAYLAAEHDRAVSRDALADALWPYALPDTWAAALRGVVTEVRRFLEDAGLDPADVLVSANGGYELRLPPGVRVDLDEARAAFRHARERLAADAPAEAAERAERAAALARRPFLPQHEGDWVDGVRDELASLHVRALELEARAHALAGDRDGTADATERLVRAEPYSETLHQLRIRLLGELGDRAAAAAAYEHCRAVLSAELGRAPSAETDAVLRAALAHAPPAAPEPGGLTRLTVLVVEEHEFQRRTAVGLLHGLGVVRIEEAADGSEALGVITRTGPPDVIVCDVATPGLDAVELIRHVAEHALGSGLIVMTAADTGVMSAIEVLAEAYGVRFLGAIEKPVTARRLAELIAGHERAAAAAAAHGDAATADEIAAALDAGRLGARFRPMADLATGTVDVVTAVPGWHDGTGGWTAAELLPGVLGSAAGLAGRLADHGLGLACALATRSRAEGRGLAVTVPLPARALEDPALADRFAAIAQAHGAEPRALVCNVGDWALRRDTRELAALTRLRIRGFGVVLEHFGTGPASAEQLARTPLTGLKIDAGLVAGAAARPDRAAAVEQALELARAVRLPAAAAGCDGPAEFDLLLQLGCRFAEGAFIAAPLDGDGVVAWAAGWQPPSVATT